MQDGGARRPLPSDPKERDEALSVNELPAGMIVSALSQICESAELKPLNPTEKAEGKMAFSAVLYEYGANLSAGVLVILWLVAVATPRVIEYLERQKKERQKQLGGGLVLPEKAA